MSIPTQISQIPIWLLALLFLLLLGTLIYALVTGREIHFWPPSIGASIKNENLENHIKQLQDQLLEEKSRNEAYQKEIERITKTYKDEILMLENRIKTADTDYTELQEKLNATWQPLLGESNMGFILTLFDRQAMKVPANEEHLIGMMKSLHHLRISLQKAGVSTIRNPLVRDTFEKIKKDLQWIEDATVVLAKKKLLKPDFFWPPGNKFIIELAEEFKDFPDSAHIAMSAEREFEDIEHFLVVRLLNP